MGGDTNNPIFNSSNTLLFGAVHAVVSVLSFGAILWRLSEPVTVGGMVLPKALFWIVIAYVLVVTIVAFVIGRPLIRLSYLNELRNAGFRYALVRLRDTGAAVGMYRGENAERKLLDGRLSEVMGNYRNWLNRMMLFFGFNVTMSRPSTHFRGSCRRKRFSRNGSRSATSGSRPARSRRYTTRCRSSATPMTNSRAIGR